MEEFTKEFMSELQNKVAFVLPIFGGIPIASSVTISWGIILFLFVFSLIFVRNLKMVPTGPQLFIETAVEGMNNFFRGILGEEGKRYFPYLGTILIYIGLANLIPILGFTPPTKDLNVTLALSILSITLIEYSGIHAKGLKGWIKSFAEPVAALAPMNLLEVFIRPLSLCMRLFGNMLGGFVVMELIKLIAPLIIPIPFSLYFDIFDGLIQTYVFVFLTAIFMNEKME